MRACVCVCVRVSRYDSSPSPHVQLLYVEVEESDGDADVSMAVPLKETSNMRPKAAVGTRVKPTVRAFVKGANTSLASAASATTSKVCV